ncbi:MAG: hypothetical protein HYT87_12850 [Nitrospirae bacterium]|nr:hypothetical protein [Nitrospirota bacterium]
MLTLKGYGDWLCDRAWLVTQGRPTLRGAVDRMVVLNRHARRSWALHAGLIYELKRDLIELLYLQGHATSVGMDRQTLKCRRCGGSGKYFHESPSNRNCSTPAISTECPGCRCWNCRGGIYAEHLLYRFVFRVDGMTVVWHQPVNLVRFQVKVTDHGVNAYEAGPENMGARAIDVRRGLLIVEKFLYRACGAKRGRVVAAVYERGRPVWERLESWVWGIKERIYRLSVSIGRRMGGWGRDTAQDPTTCHQVKDLPSGPPEADRWWDDEIPF